MYAYVTTVKIVACGMLLRNLYILYVFPDNKVQGTNTGPPGATGPTWVL